MVLHWCTLVLEFPWMEKGDEAKGKNGNSLTLHDTCMGPRNVSFAAAVTGIHKAFGPNTFQDHVLFAQNQSGAACWQTFNEAHASNVR